MIPGRQIYNRTDRDQGISVAVAITDYFKFASSPTDYTNDTITDNAVMKLEQFDWARHSISATWKLDNRYAPSKKLLANQESAKFAVRDKTSKVERCLKTVVKSNQPVVTDSDRRAVNEIKREIDILKSLDHPHIVKLYESVEDLNFIHAFYDQLTGIDLGHHFMYSGVVFDEPYIARIMKQVLQAVSYCHKRHIVHKDIKLDNVMLDVTKQEVKLIDFGVSENLGNQKSTPTFDGSPHYLPPEAFTLPAYPLIQRHGFTFKSDIWAIGVALYVLATRNYPSGSYDAFFLRLMQVHNTQQQYFAFAHLSVELRDLIRKMLTIDPDERPTADECLQHKWFSLAPNDKVTAVDLNTISNNMKAFSKRGQLYAAMCNLALHELPCDTTDAAVRMFKYLDLYNDGTVDSTTLGNYLTIYMKWPQLDIANLLKVITSRGGNGISVSEFIAAARNWNAEGNRALFSRVFDKLDVHCKGYLGVEEFVQCTGISSSRTIKDIQNLMQLICTNSDGRITKTAFINYMMA